MNVCVIQRRPSSHSTSHLMAAAAEPAGSDGQTSKPVSINEEFRSRGVKDACQRGITARDVIGGSRPVTSRRSTSSPGLRFTSCLPATRVDDNQDVALMLQPTQPSTFLPPPPPPPPYPYHHLSPPTYMTSFPAPLYPVRPHPLTPMTTQFRPTPFDGCVSLQVSCLCRLRFFAYLSFSPSSCCAVPLL